MRQNGIASRNGAVDLMRFVCSVMIVLLHGSAYLPKGVAMYSLRGGLCVEFFFFVSGYLMVCSAQKRRGALCGSDTLSAETVRFMKRKVNGMMPNVWVAAIISFLVLFFSLPNGSAHLFFEKLTKEIWRPMLMTSFGFGEPNELWYLSSMLIVMIIFYPLLVKYFDMFVRVCAPLIAALCLGYIIKEQQSLLSPSKWLDFMYKGQIRAFGDLALGIAIYPVIQAMQKQRFKTAPRVLIDLIQLACWGISFYVMMSVRKPKYDAFVLLLIAAATVLAFSHQGFFAGAFDNRFSLFLGKLSLTVYLSHYWLTFTITNLYPRAAARGWLGLSGAPAADSTKIWCVYLLAVACASAFVYIVSAALRAHSAAIFKKIKAILFLPEQTAQSE